MNNIDFEYWFTIATGLIGVLIILFLTGCREQSSRWEWSTEQQCLIDHYQETCYTSPAEMALLTTRDSAASAHIMERAQMVKKIEEMHRQARNRHPSNQDKNVQWTRSDLSEQSSSSP